MLVRRPVHWLIFGVLASATVLGSATDINPLTAEHWRTRPLVIVVPAADDPLLGQVEAALSDEPARTGFAEREMVLYTVVAGRGSRDGQPLPAGQTRALLDALGVAADGPATAFLVGKDGGVKVTARGNVSLEGLFGAIDQMPMRRR